MKKLLAIVLAITCLLTAVACSGKNDTETVILPEDIEKITIVWNGGPLTTFSYTDDAKISRLEEYFTSLELLATKEDPTQYNGGTWLITAETDADTIEMSHFGNKFFRTDGGEWREISYEQASAFETILKENIPDELPQNIMFEEWEQRN